MGKKHLMPKKPGAGTKVPTTPKFKSNITRLAANVFIFGTVQDAANYDDTKNHIVRYIATQDFLGAAVAAQVAATLLDPSDSEPEQPEENITTKKEDGTVISINNIIDTQVSPQAYCRVRDMESSICRLEQKQENLYEIKRARYIT